ncbi:MAG: NlpC/P60 family protein, partial [Planctomycetota bacterium]
MNDAVGEQGVVRRPVVFTFDDPADPGSVQTQLRHGAVVETLGHRQLDGRAWARVRYGWGVSSRYDEPDAADEGWLEASAVVPASRGGSARRYTTRCGSSGEAGWLQVTSLAAHGFAGPSRTAEPSVMVLPAESWLHGLELTGVQAAPGAYGSRWWRVELPTAYREYQQLFFQEGDVQPGGARPLGPAAAINEALRMMHRPYIWGGASSFGFDCSGLVQMVARRQGVALPHSARRQFAQTAAMPGLRAVGEDLTVADLRGEVRSEGGRGLTCSALG